MGHICDIRGCAEVATHDVFIRPGKVLHLCAEDFYAIKHSAPETTEAKEETRKGYKIAS